MLIEVDNQYATATISLQGAQVLKFKPKRGQPVLWFPEENNLVKDRPIRGGIPVCWPWYGKQDGVLHGFARNNDWELESNKNLDTGETEINLVLKNLEKDFWPHEFILKLTVLVGKELKITLSTKNIDDHEFKFENLLHTYLNISNINNVEINGLENVVYLDEVNSFEKEVESDTLLINQEVDRIYLHKGNVEVLDYEWKRKIIVNKTNSNSTVIWNPGIDKAKRLVDFPDEEYEHMICIEAGNVLEDNIVLKPGEINLLTTTIQVGKI